MMINFKTNINIVPECQALFSVMVAVVVINTEPSGNYSYFRGHA